MAETKQARNTHADKFIDDGAGTIAYEENEKGEKSSCFRRSAPVNFTNLLAVR